MLQKRSLIRNYEEEKAPEKETKPIGWIEKSNIQSSPAVISLYFKEHFITFPTTRGGSIQTFYSVSTYEAGYNPPPNPSVLLFTLAEFRTPLNEDHTVQYYSHTVQFKLKC